ncbi:MFS transporter [Streptomyces sp. NPDC059994]|uniref:MFS transporter n=1 Tax=Streptomyces sp. NPDC059994 TaxID=3347029 RepID=UPI00367F0D52
MSSPTTAPPPPTSLPRIVAASLIGTTIEWYDFFLYGSAAALVFNKLFFPGSDPLVGTLLSFLTYAVGFAARPIGALVFGHFGDRVGRKKLLVLSLLMMGGATFAIGLLPTHATVGSAAPVLLTALRLVQGFALGGEWGGAVLLVSEHGDARRRGFWASWPQTGAPAGQLLATGVLSALTALLSDDAFLSWGWRVPFLLSGVLVLVGLWIRLSVDESPLFKAALERAESRKAAEPDRVAEKLPLVAVLRDHWRDVLVAMGARMAENISYYVITAFILVYATTSAGMAKQTALNAVLIASAVHFAVIPAWGALSDRIGRRPVYLIGAVGVGAWMFPFFSLIDTADFGNLVLAITVGLVFHGAMYAPQAAFFTEMFATRMRYSGASIGAQFASVAAGAPAPLIATALLSDYDSSTPIALYVIAAAVLTVIALVCAQETRHRDLAEVDAESRSRDSVNV